MYFDLQVNGYAGVDFNSQVSVDQIHHACEMLRRDHVEGILATLITDDVSAMCQRMERICQARQQSPLVGQIIQGFHLEGPFLCPQPGYVGAHPAKHVLPANLEVMKRLQDAAQGHLRLVTLAPECDSQLRVTRYLADQKVVVSAGHCHPDLEIIQAAIDAGLTMVTHLGNACPLQLHRHDNVIQRFLSLAQHLWIGWIADGVHIPYFALRNYLQLAPRSFFVTDAIAAAGCGPGQYSLGQQQVIVDDQGATWSSDRQNLVGSACTMQQIQRNLEREWGWSPQQVQQWTWDHPRLAIGLSAPWES